ncbi:hypothetical protein C7S18_20920 [Ahniella affigens]|uniref:FG-GAP repeat protein n=1 Tax=Ahniella affigens TaxID=2021234 RepID=A0A2P1PXC1_9GAMM|nr:FG-GAP-like repeat-containing protein [Ahniella affigens]AVP99482.1 hypothetical protein C7S18_20920 [Ahniella affigens]
MSRCQFLRTPNASLTQANVDVQTCIKFGTCTDTVSRHQTHARPSWREPSLAQIAAAWAQRRLPLALLGLSISVVADAHYANGLADLRMISSPVTQGQNARAVASLGDITGDGFVDFALGVPGEDLGGTAPGAGGISIFPGNGTAPNPGAGSIFRLYGVDAGEAFGSSLAGVGDLNGDGIGDFVVGSPTFDAPGAVDAGRVRVYFGQLATNPMLVAEIRGTQAGSQFGFAVAGAGDLNGDGYADLMIGVPYYDDNNRVDSGQAQIFFGGTGTNFDTAPDVSLAPTAAGSRFGASLASAGDFNGDGLADFVVGVPNASVGQTGEGAGLLYLGIVGGVDVLADLAFESDQIGAGMGVAVAAGGDVNGDGLSDIVLGVPLYDDGQSNEGAAFVYFGGTTPNNTVDQILQFNVAGELSGASLDLGDTNGDGYADLAIGAPLATDYGIGEFGKVRVATGSSTGLGADTFETRGLSSTTNAGHYGAAVAFADYNADGFAELFVGAPDENATGRPGQGFAYLVRTDRRLSTTIDANIAGTQAGAQQGFAVASGDLNGDGLSDLAVGQPNFDTANANAGRVEIYYGTLGGFDATPDVSLTGNAANVQFGRALAIGDFNRDGYGDLAVGAPIQASNGGEVHLYYGNAGTLNTAVDRVLSIAQTGAQYGDVVANAGDLNSDGYPELAIGAPLADIGGASNAGVAYFYLGGPSVIAVTPLELQGAVTELRIGRSLAAIGDSNGDGFNDMAVGAKLGTSDTGQVRVLFGSANFDTISDQTLNVGLSGARCSEGLSTAGDMNGDGFSDLAVGCPGASQTTTNEGLVALYLGSPTGFGTAPNVSFLPTLSSGELGRALAGGTDLDGDGFADLLIGQPFASSGANSNNGGVRWQRGAATVSATAGPQVTVATNDVRVGSSLATGDVDGDGFADIIMGAPGTAGGASAIGGFHVVHPLGTGRNASAQQFRNPTNALDFNGSTDSPIGAFIALDGQAVRGRERVRLEVQWCPNGRPFGSVGCFSATSGTWDDLGNGSLSTLSVAAVQTLTPGTTYSWRARLQYAPMTITAPGIVAPTSPARVSPWRRMRASGGQSDLRTIVDVLLKDGFE